MKTKLGFIGTGNMAKAILSIAKQKGCKNIVAFDTNAENLKSVNAYAKTASDNQSVINYAKYIFVCVKPNQAASVFANLDIPEDKVLISVMAGVSIDKLSTLSKAKKIVRVMPNLHASVGMSFNAYNFIGITDKERGELFDVINLFGLPRAIDEKHMDAITGLVGSSPAFIYKFAIGLIGAAKLEGVPPECAIMATLGVLGGASMHLAAELNEILPKKNYEEALAKIDNIIKSICSEGGTTIEGVNYLTAHHFETVVQNATISSITKSKDMSSAFKVEGGASITTTAPTTTEPAKDAVANPTAPVATDLVGSAPVTKSAKDEKDSKKEKKDKKKK